MPFLGGGFPGIQHSTGGEAWAGPELHDASVWAEATLGN